MVNTLNAAMNFDNTESASPMNRKPIKLSGLRDIFDDVTYAKCKRYFHYLNVCY